ncbi:HU family DNA-binding protein [Acetobacter sp. TBRC 12305]|uniref:HU family DNA-binding protein n=1 Tax=Acetobacter garciniae TaxID=2817435 RepID=A0A939HR35_9PROT|nr:HU family DNA-binding protein [Acetobacter garciniae]MBX0346054.1 HU family DNA-binding protein [Acetobacter garciniae]
MSKAFIAAVLQDSLGCTGVAAARAADDVIAGIVGEIQRDGLFTLPGFGRFTRAERPAAQKLNPRTQEPVQVAASRTVRFKASPVLRELVDEKPAKAQAIVKTPERKGAGRGGNSGGKPVSRAAARRADSRA